MTGWVLRFMDCELAEADALGVHVALVVATLDDDTFELDPTRSPSRLMAWLAAMVAVQRQISLAEAQQLVAASKAEDIFAALTPGG